MFWPSYDQFIEVWFCDFSWSLESRSSASSEAILIFSTDLKSLVHALFTIYYDKFSFNQFFRSKTQCGCAYCSDFCFSWWHRPLWRRGAVEYQLSTHPPLHPPPARISLWITHLSQPWADSPTNLWAIQPTCREITDFKKAVSQRVNDTGKDLINCVVARQR